MGHDLGYGAYDNLTMIWDLGQVIFWDGVIWDLGKRIIWRTFELLERRERRIVFLFPGIGSEVQS